MSDPAGGQPTESCLLLARPDSHHGCNADDRDQPNNTEHNEDGVVPWLHALHLFETEKSEDRDAQEEQPESEDKYHTGVVLIRGW